MPTDSENFASLLIQSAAVDTALASLKTALDARAALAVQIPAVRSLGRHQDRMPLLQAISAAGLAPYLAGIQLPPTVRTMAADDALNLQRADAKHYEPPKNANGWPL